MQTLIYITIALLVIATVAGGLGFVAYIMERIWNWMRL